MSMFEQFFSAVQSKTSAVVAATAAGVGAAVGGGGGPVGAQFTIGDRRVEVVKQIAEGTHFRSIGRLVSRARSKQNVAWLIGSRTEPTKLTISSLTTVHQVALPSCTWFERLVASSCSPSSACS